MKMCAVSTVRYKTRHSPISVRFVSQHNFSVFHFLNLLCKSLYIEISATILNVCWCPHKLWQKTIQNNFIHFLFILLSFLCKCAFWLLFTEIILLVFTLKKSYSVRDLFLLALLSIYKKTKNINRIVVPLR